MYLSLQGLLRQFTEAGLPNLPIRLAFRLEEDMS